MRYIEEWGSGLRRVNRVLAEYGIRFVAIDEVAFATQMNVYRIGGPDHEGNEGDHDPNEPNRVAPDRRPHPSQRWNSRRLGGFVKTARDSL